MEKPIDAPPLRWFLGDDKQRALAKRYWVSETATGLGHVAIYNVMRLLPIDFVSDLGEKAGHRARASFATADRRVHENWARLRPEEAERAEAVTEYAFGQTGRVHWEFATLARLQRAGRVTIDGAENVAAAHATGRPILMAGVHLANWEIGGIALAQLGHKTTSLYQPPPNRFDHRLALKARGNTGCELLPQGPAGARQALRVLKERKRILGIYVDECIEGDVYAPFFGRAPRLDGNMARAVRLAVMADALLIPAYAVRTEGLHFRVTFLPPVDLLRPAGGEADLLENVARLNAVFEPIVRAHLDQWFWLFDLRLK